MMESANPIPRPAPNVNLDEGDDVVTTLPAPMAVQESTVRIGRTPRHYARRVFIPDDLAEAARGGMTFRRIARILGMRLGRTVSRETVRKWLIHAGVHRPRRQPARVAPRISDTGIDFTDQEDRRLRAFNRTRTAEMQHLLARARAGDRGALMELHDRYQLRLPLIEARMDPPLPWTQETFSNDGVGKTPAPVLESPGQDIVSRAA